MIHIFGSKKAGILYDPERVKILDPDRALGRVFQLQSGQ
jgi:hypothetical protein